MRLYLDIQGDMSPTTFEQVSEFTGVHINDLKLYARSVKPGEFDGATMGEYNFIVDKRSQS
jgi:hypothetical protein